MRSYELKRGFQVHNEMANADGRKARETARRRRMIPVNLTVCGRIKERVIEGLEDRKYDVNELRRRRETAMERIKKCRKR